MSLCVTACITDAYDQTDRVPPGIGELDEPRELDDPDELGVFTVPTEDGMATHRFRFVADGDAIAVFVASPNGYPAPDLPEECALDTFLRVAPADTAIPPALLLNCDRAELVEPSRRQTALRVDDLRTADHVLPFATASAEVCTKAAFDDRVELLEEMAAFRSLTVLCTGYDCTRWVEWNASTSNCHFENAAGETVGYCPEPTDYYVQAPVGRRCLAHTPRVCNPAYNPACTHEAPVDAWYRWNESWYDWRSEVTRVRLELSGCGVHRTGYWRRWNGTGWGPTHAFSTGADTYEQLTLSAGSSGGTWNADRFYLHIDKHGPSKANIIAAWIKMGGLSTSTCELGL